MTRLEKEKWLNNIRIVATEVAQTLGMETVRHILMKYGARSIEYLSPIFYSEVFDELDFMANDCRE